MQSSSTHSIASLEGLQATLEISSWGMVVIGAVTLIATLFITAPYGKFSKPTGWGVRLPARLTWMIMESPNIWIPFLLLQVLPSNVAQHSAVQWQNVYDLKNHPNTVLLIMFLSHYIHRSLIFPLFLAQGNPMPISVMFLAFGYCSWNGFNQAMSLLFINKHDPTVFWSQPRTFVGIGFFLLGMTINMVADYSLIAQKKIAQEKNVQYIIPQGIVFNVISCPNYFGEVLEWLGFAIAANNITAYAFVWYTFCNLLPRALAHHKWYNEKFEDYPKQRKAMIPFFL